MRIFIAVVVIIVVLLLVGWMTVSFQDYGATIQINPEKVEEDTQSMIEGGKKIVEGVDESVDAEVEETAEGESGDAALEVELEEEPVDTP